MPRLFGIGAICAAASFFFGCAALSGTLGSTYAASVRGEYDENGTFSAELYFYLNPDGQTFVGVLRKFRFTRPGFNAPSGTVSVEGTVSRDETEEVLLHGVGNGELKQGLFSYQLEFEMESSYVDERRGIISGWYFGGGDFNRGDDYLGWPKIRGTFRSVAICQPTPPKPSNCGLPETVVPTR